MATRSLNRREVRKLYRGILAAVVLFGVGVLAVGLSAFVGTIAPFVGVNLLSLIGYILIVVSFVVLMILSKPVFD